MTMAVFRTVSTILAVAALYIGAASAQQPANSVKRFDDSIIAPGQTGPANLAATPLTDSARRTTTLQLHFGLTTRNMEELQSRVARGERISPSEMASKYAGDSESAS